jgi:hypothetical protein
LLAGPVLEIFAKRDGWYEYSLYERKVSVIEGEDVTSMGIETTLKIGDRRIWEARWGSTNELRITNPMQFDDKKVLGRTR